MAVTKRERDKVIEQVTSLLYKAKANAWSVQDKGALLAAVKLQLQESPGGKHVQEI